MALSVEKLLNDAHLLITRLKDHDFLADSIIGSSQGLYNKVEAMKQYQDDITELNEIAKHRPRSTLVLGIAQENRQIRQLQQENRELEASLEEHQSALELIMQKYREHTVKLIQSNQVERALKGKEVTEKNSMCHLMDKIDEMAGVMQKAIEVDETTASVDKEDLSRLQVENKALREMLEICSTQQDKIVPESIFKNADISKQEDLSPPKPEGEESESDEDTATLKRPEKSPKEEEEEDSSDGDSGTLKRNDGPSKQEDSKKDEKKEKDKEAAVEPKKKADGKKGEAGAKDGASAKDSSANNNSRSGSRSPVTSKSTTDVKKSRTVSSPVKRSSLASSAKKETASSSVKKSPSVEMKKDLKSKTTPKTSARK